MSDFAISISGLSKSYKIYDNPALDPIKEVIFWWRKPQHRSFHALSDISLKIKKGEVVGVIGPNGAGKTTLLKIVAGLLKPNSGEVLINGSVTAMLAQGTGFHDEFTGKENILYGGLMLGMKKSEILAKMEQIIEFADIGEHINLPMRTYSTGMKARLIFATSMHIQPDIMIVDEALATGDGEFFEKSLNKIHEIVSSGATILFVSHNLRQIKELCQRSVVLYNGKIIFDGDTTRAVDLYTRKIIESKDAKLQLRAESLSRKPNEFIGSGEVTITEAQFYDNNKSVKSLKIGEPCTLKLKIHSKCDLKDVSFCVEIRSEKSPITYAFIPSCHPKLATFNNTFDVSKGSSEIVIEFGHLTLGDGVYTCDIEIFPKSIMDSFEYEKCYSYYTGLIQFQAYYEDTSMFGRGTLAEVPIKSFTCVPLASASSHAEASN